MYHTSAKEISSWLKTIEEFLISGSYRPPEFLKPFHLLTLAIAAQRQNQQDQIFDILDDTLKEYAYKMGLWKAAAIKPPTYITEKYNSTMQIVPLEILDNPAQCERTANRLSQLAAKQGLIAEDSAENLWAILVELLSNYYCHSEANEIFGLVCAQSWPKANLVQIAIADGGIGIRQSLQNNPALINRLRSDNACQLATEYGITGKPDGPHSGYGLTLTRSVVKNAGGKLLLISGEEAFVENNDRTQNLNLNTGWQGTLLVLEWNIGKHLDTKLVYDSWPSVEFGEDEWFHTTN